jgi:hypothetical protein
LLRFQWPANQNIVFAADKSAKGGTTVTIISSGAASNNVWFAPAGTISFSENATTMTKATSGTATTITAPTTEGAYKHLNYYLPHQLHKVYKRLQW